MSSWEESASLVVLETMAMAYGYLLLYDGGPSEEVGEAGVVIPEISPNRMADAIVDLAQSPQKRRAMGSRAQNVLASNLAVPRRSLPSRRSLTRRHVT